MTIIDYVRDFPQILYTCIGKTIRNTAADNERVTQ